MASDSKSDKSQLNRPRRLRFSLKWLLLVMAVLCVSLGLFAMLERKSREMLAMHQAVLDTLNANFVSEPNDVRFVNPEAVRRSAAVLEKSAAGTTKRGQSVSRFFGKRTLYSSNEINVSLDVATALAGPQGKNILSQLPSHYGRGLSNIGLKQTSMSFSPGLASEFWQDPKHGVLVITDAFLHESSKRVLVRAVFIQNDRASIW
jgi:hypothetical protein